MFEKIRIEEIIIHNIKNVKYGRIVMDELSYIEKGNFTECNSILGIYGQNGSGKTTLLQATKILRTLLRGETLNKEVLKYICNDSNEAKLNYTFYVEEEDNHFLYNYECTISSVQIESNNGYSLDTLPEVTYEKITVKSYDLDKKKWNSKISLYEGSNQGITLQKLNNSLGKKYSDRLNAIREVEIGSSRVFGGKIKRFLLEALNRKKDHTLYNLIQDLSTYAYRNLLIIENDYMGTVSLTDLFVINGYLVNDDLVRIGNILVNGTDSVTYTNEQYNLIQVLIAQIDVVLNEIVPGLHLKVINVQKQLMEDGNMGHALEIVTQKDNEDYYVPVKYESEGIKRIISIISALVAAYNNSSICLMIDEFDSGIFEYLLGELIQIYNESGKGQLIFTSHNLIALERLGPKSLLFTTSNPEDRFTYLTGIKPNNNIRDQYYKSIVLGNDHQLYTSTKEYKIKRAFRKAGVINNE